MERLSVSESISKRWTTLKTEMVGGPSNSRELNISKHDGDNCTTNGLKCLTFYGGSEQQTTIFFSFS